MCAPSEFISGKNSAGSLQRCELASAFLVLLFNLFNFLRKLDKLKKTKISIYPIPKNGIGKVINERLSRAKVNE